MSDNDSDEPIGRRNSSSRTKSRSSGSKKKNSAPSKTKSKRKIISSDEENMEEVVIKKAEKHLPEIHRSESTITMDVVESTKLTESSSLSPILGTSLEPPSFSPLLKGPPSPRHHNESLKWKHKVNLLGEKVVDPMIHICDKCYLPILIYARMIPCKHVFCLECGRAADKLCHKCNEKVSRVEQTTLGKVFMCTHQQSKTRELCKRTYLSQRDLQAHIAHRHVKCKEKEKEKSTSASVAVTRDPRSAHALPATVPSAALQRVSSAPNSVAAPPPSKVVAFNPPPPPAPPLPPIPALSGPVPPAGPPPPYLTPPPVYAPQMVPPPSAVYTGGQYPPVPTAVHASAYVHAAHPQAYGQPPPPPPTAYAPQPTGYEDFRGAPPPPPSHWQQRPPPQRDYRAPPQGYYRQ